MTAKGRIPSAAHARVRAKWRPSLGAVVGLVLSVVLALPIAGMAAVVVLSRSPEQLVASLAANAGKITVAGTLILLVTGLVGFLFWRLVTKPVSQLIDWTEAVGKGEGASLDRTHHGTRELATLAESFSAMVERLEERSRYIETFTAHVSHELKSPLTSIAGAAELMRDAGEAMDAATRGRFLDNIARDTERLSALVARMRDLARAETTMARGSIRLGDLVRTLRERFLHLDIDVLGDIHGGRSAEDVVLALPAVEAIAILSHLADNAERHGARMLRLAVSAGDAATRLAVSNDGAPISTGNRAHIFEPFYTTRRESGGTGMGLAIVRAMLKAHGGEIACAADAECVTFEITLRT